MAETSLLADASSTGTVPEDSWVNDHEFADGVAGQIGKFESVEALGNSYAELQKLQGTLLSPPKEGDTDEARAAKMDKIYSQLGRPESAADYKVEKPAEVPEGMEWSDAAAQSLKEMAFGIGLSQAQLDKAVAWQLEQQTKTVQTIQAAEADRQKAITAEKAAAVDKLKATHGNSGYDAIVQGAVNLLKSYGNDSIVQKFQEAGFDRDPEILEMFSKMNTKELGEDSLVTGTIGQLAGDNQALTYPNSPELKGS